jgi:DNA modification methylase
VKRVLRPDGLVFCNLGDSYSGSGKGPSGKNGLGDQEQRQGFAGGRGKASFKVQRGDDPAWSNSQQRTGAVQGIPAKNLLLIPERFAIGMQERGWIVRQQIVWAKRAPMPESIRDRFTRSWEPIWMFSKAPRYFFDQEAVRVESVTPTDEVRGQKLYARPVNGTGRNMNGLGATTLGGGNPSGANMRDVWWLSPEPNPDAHYASFVTELPKRCILAGSRPGDTVLDPFLGSGTTALVADRLGRDAIGIELSSEYVRMAKKRLESDAPMVSEPVEVVGGDQLGLFEAAI